VHACLVHMVGGKTVSNGIAITAPKPKYRSCTLFSVKK